MVKFEFCMDFLFLIFCVVLVVIIQSEAMLMPGIVPEKQQRQIFEQLIQGALDQVVKDGEAGFFIAIYSKAEVHNVFGPRVAVYYF